tara:strand:- start:579 stop:920 length:342 start_codon:yes stop_codon:yes gene_type:complete
LTVPAFTWFNKSLIALHMLIPKSIEIIKENMRDFIIEKLMMLNALTKIIVRPVKNENQLDIVLGFSSGIGDNFLVVQLFSFAFIMSANINPDIRQINAPHDNQKIGSSIGFIC